MRRSKLRALLSEGIDVRYNKRLSSISYSEDGQQVTAHFEDGSRTTGRLLVGADGSRSTVRELLLGSEQAALSPVPYAASFTQARYTREQAVFLRQSFRLFLAAIHPLGLFSWFGLHDVPDPDDPASWVFYTYISYPLSMEDQVSSADWPNEKKIQQLKTMARDFTEPWKSAYAWMPDDQPVWRHGMASWDPSEPKHRWDSKHGRVTLAGDAAHPMTYRSSCTLLGKSLSTGLILLQNEVRPLTMPSPMLPNSSEQSRAQ
jgi:2-polyprenyl-6-methoxyphenol hydroxylase-like FAD-dependent oxidoreductase